MDKTTLMDGSSAVEIEDIETGQRMVSAGSHRSTGSRPRQAGMMISDKTAIISDEIREETKRRNEASILEQAKMTSRNLGEALRKKTEAYNVRKIKRNVF